MHISKSESALLFMTFMDSHVLVRHAVGVVQLGVSSTFEHLLLLDALFLELQRSFARTL